MSGQHTSQSVIHWSVRLCLGGFVLLTSWSLTWPQPASLWVQLGADRDLIAGSTLQVRVNVAPPLATREFLVVDLYSMNHRREPRGFLSGSAPQQIPPQGGLLEYRFPIPKSDELGYIYAVIYAGPTGLWRDNTRSAVTEPVAASWSSSPSTDETSVRWIAHDNRSQGAVNSVSSRPAQWITALIWMAAATLYTRHSWYAKKKERARSKGGAHLILVWASACLAAACWELASADTALAIAARRFAMELHLYYQRELFQILATTSVLAIGLWISVRVIEAAYATNRMPWMLLGLTLFSMASAAALISHHAVDRFAGTLWCTIPAIQWLKMFAGGLALAGTLLPSERQVACPRKLGLLPSKDARKGGSTCA